MVQGAEGRAHAGFRKFAQDTGHARTLNLNTLACLCQMRIVVDANIVIAGVLGLRSVIAIVTSGNHTLFAPMPIIEEINKHDAFICAREGLTREEFEVRRDSLLKFAILVEQQNYRHYIKQSRTTLENRDVSDAHYVACALAVRADFIWTNDNDLTAQTLVPVKTTQQFIDERKTETFK